MNIQNLRDSSVNDKLVMSIMAGLAMFVAGYTVTRMTLSQTTPQDNAAVENSVLPHQAELWKDFAN